FLCGLFNSFILNAIVRMLMGSHVTTSLVEALPVPVWRESALERRIARLARRLADGSPSSAMAARLQGAVRRLDGIVGDAFDRLVEGFPLVPQDDRRRALEALRRRVR